MASRDISSASAETVRTLARLVLSRATADIDANAIRHAQLLLLDTIGCGIAGAHDATARTVTELAIKDGATPQCAIIGRREKTSLLNAVLANGVAVRVLDWNDYFIGESNGEPETAGHPSDNIPVALAVGAARRSTGADVLASIVTGYELYARLQHRTDRDSAWDAVTVSGLVAPAMAGRLIGLDEEKLAHGLALGAARAATPAIVRTGHISAAKSIANALVAQAGVQAALFAENGLTGPLPVLDDRRGLRDLFPRGDPTELVAPMPADGGVTRAHVKAYPCVNTGQSAVAAALELHKALDGSVGAIASLDIVMADYTVVKRHQGDKGRARPTSREAADHSFPFIVAVTLIDGVFGISQFHNERWRDPKVVALMEKIVMHRDPKLNARAPGAFPCLLRATKTDGSKHIVEVDYPPGFSRDGLDDATVLEKFHAITAPILPASARMRIVDAVMDFHEARSTATLEAAISTQGTRQ
jgi:2-methylcitrate dehydratase